MFEDRVAEYSVYTPVFRLALLSPTVLCFFLKTFFVIVDHTGTSLAFSHVVFGAPSHTLRLYKKKAVGSPSLFSWYYISLPHHHVVENQSERKGAIVKITTHIQTHSHMVRQPSSVAMLHVMEMERIGMSLSFVT